MITNRLITILDVGYDNINNITLNTDEYDKSYSEYVRKYMDEMINYINSKGLECRFWASLGTNGFAGTTPVSTDAVAHMWSHSWASFDEMKEAGYKFINNADGILYIVPWAGYNNYLNIKNLYNTWEYSNLNRGYYLAAGHPQLLGAEAAVDDLLPDNSLCSD